MYILKYSGCILCVCLLLDGKCKHHYLLMAMSSDDYHCHVIYTLLCLKVRKVATTIHKKNSTDAKTLKIMCHFCHQLHASTHFMITVILVTFTFIFSSFIQCYIVLIVRHNTQQSMV